MTTESITRKYSATIKHQNGEEFLRDGYDMEYLCQDIIEDFAADNLINNFSWQYEYNKEGVESAASEAGVEVTWHEPKTVSMREGNVLLRVNDETTTSVLLRSNLNALRVDYKMTDKDDAEKTEKIAVEITGTQLKIYNSEGLLLQAYIDNDYFVPVLQGELFKNGMKRIK